MKNKINKTISIIFSLGLLLASYSNVYASSSITESGQQAAPRVYIADKNNVGGKSCNDSWAGTLAQPLCTISKGIALLQPGDTLFVRGGTYPSFSVSKSGTASNYITISGYSNEMPLISGGRGIELKGTSYVAIRGFEVIGATGNWAGGITIINLNTSRPLYNIVEGNKVHDNIYPNMSGILISEGSYNKILHNEVYNNYYVGIRVSSVSNTATDNEIGFNSVYNQTLAGSNSDGISLDGTTTTRTYIHDNVVHDNSDDGFDTWDSSYNIIVGNVSYNQVGNGDGNGFKMGGVNGGHNLIKNNIAYNNKARGFDSNGSGGNVYYNNVAYNNIGYGFQDVWRRDASCTAKSCPGIFINNIGYNNVIGNFSAGPSTLTSHNNIWYSSSGSPRAAYNYDVYPSLSALYAASGNRLDNPNAGDLSSLQVDPQFVNPMAFQFGLLPTSPAIDHGDPANPGQITAVDVVDIGAFEYSSNIFMDVSSAYWASNYIERLYSAGITGGCSSGNYCPDSVVTRAQMAVFLLKGIHGADYAPPASGDNTGFLDVALDYWAAAWIKQLAAEGITGGCGNGNYCPDATVTRAQMAIFILKAKHGSSYSPPNALGVFADVPSGYWADKWIEQLAAEGVTSGCGTGIYCPDDSVTRAQMAVFLVKAFNLP